MHRSGTARHVAAALVAAAATLITAACSQATTAASTHTESSVQVTSPTSAGSQSQTIRYETDVNAASTPLDVPVEVAWRRVYQAYAALKIPVTVVDSAHGIIGARGARIRNRLVGQSLSSWFDCGTTAVGSPRADSYGLLLTMLTEVRPAQNGSTARTIVSATAEASDTHTGAMPCSSKGGLEAKLEQAITTP